MKLRRKKTSYRYIVILLVVLFLNAAIYIVASVFLQNRSLQLQSAQVNLDIALPEVIKQVTVDGVKSLQWLNLSSNVSSQTGIQATGVADRYPEPLPPTHVVVYNTKIGSSVVLRWQSANGQTYTGVEIYRSTETPDKPLKDMELLTTQTLQQGEYFDEAVENGTTYYYTLRSYRTLPDENGAAAASYSDMTDVFSVIPTDESAPRGPRWVQVQQYDSKTETGLLVTWESIIDADVDKINIYRSTEPGTVGVNIQSVTPDVTQLVDTTVEPAVNYYYTVTAIDAAGNESSQTLNISRYGNTAPFVSGDQEASERITNGN